MRYPHLMRCVLAPFISLGLCMAPLSAMADGWQTTVTPYLWLAGQKGTVDAFANLPAVDIDASFKDDILGNINFAFMTVVETRKDRAGILMDIAYMDVEESAALRGIVFDSASLQSKLWLFTLGGAYRLTESGEGFLDFVAGAKYISWENVIRLANDGSTRSVSGKDDWFDLLVGFRGKHSFGDSPWFVNGAVLGGGFGIASDSLWDLNLNLGYQWTESFATTLGYRYFDIDYEDDGFLVDIAFDGAVLGFVWNW